MKTMRCTALATAVAILSSAPHALAQVKHWKDVTIPTLRGFDVAQPERHVLDNGLTVLLMPDPELPLVNLELRIRTGGRLVPVDKTGLADIFGDAWRTGGTTTRTGDQLDDLLEAKAAKVETSMGDDSASLTLNCLKADFPSVLDVFMEVLRKPAFAQDKIDLAKKQMNTAISRRNDSPDDIVRREATKLGYGADSPYARVAEYATVAAVTREDLLQWHGTYVHPERSFVAVSGDFKPAEMLATLKKSFGAWPKGPGTKDPEIPYQRSTKPGIYFVEKNDVTQASIIMVDLGIKRDNPDLYAVEVLNEIFSGGFTSRLFSSVRSTKGLAYAVWGGVFAGYDRPGLTMVGMGTKNTTVAAGIDALREEIDGVLGAKPVTDEELKRAKDAILNSFIFRVDSKRKVLNQQLTYAFFDYPPDFLQRYQAGIEKVTKEDVMRVAKSYIKKDQLAVLVLGKPADFDRKLDTFGAVTPIDVTIPEPAAAPKAAASAETTAKGKVLFAKMVEGLGGPAKVDAVKEIEFAGSLTMKTPMGEMAGSVKGMIALPDRYRQEMNMGGMAMAMVVSPTASFMAMGPQSQDMPGSEKEELQKELKRNPIAIAKAREDAKLKVNHAGTEKVGGVAAELLEVENDGAEVRFAIDPATGRILQASYRSKGPQGPAENVSTYGDYKQVDGMWLAFSESVTQNGEAAQTIKIESYKINPGLDAKLFAKPTP